MYTSTHFVHRHVQKRRRSCALLIEMTQREGGGGILQPPPTCGITRTQPYAWCPMPTHMLSYRCNALKR